MAKEQSLQIETNQLKSFLCPFNLFFTLALVYLIPASFSPYVHRIANDCNESTKSMKKKCVFIYM